MDPRPILLLTRPDPGSRTTLSMLTSAMGKAPEAVISPLMRIEYRQLVPPLPQDAVLLFSSSHGVFATAKQETRRHFKALCVGDATMQAARVQGFDAISAGGDADDLVRLTVAEMSGHPGVAVHAHGEHSLGDIASRLRKQGIRAQERVVYRQLAHPLTDEAAQALETRRVIAPVYSPRTARLLAGAISDLAPLDLWIIAFSPAVAEVFPEMRNRMDILPRPDSGAMIDAIGRRLR